MTRRRLALLVFLIVLVIGGVIFTGYAALVPEAGNGIAIIGILAVAFAWIVSAKLLGWPRRMPKVFVVAAVLIVGGLLAFGFGKSALDLLFPEGHEWIASSAEEQRIPLDRGNIARMGENSANRACNQRLLEMQQGLERMEQAQEPLELMEAARSALREFKERCEQAAQPKPKRLSSPSANSTPAVIPSVTIPVATTGASAFNPTKCSDEYVTLMDTHLANHPTVPRNLALAVMQWESGCDPKAVSSKGAQGLMQLMPDTARDLGVSDPFDPDQNIRGGVQYLAQQHADFASTEMALAAYNWGPGPDRLGQYRGNSWAVVAAYAPDETRKFVSGVIALAHSFDSSPVHLTGGQSHSTVSMVITNYRAEPISLFWVDFSGQEIPYATPLPRGGWNQPTYPGHVWKVRDARGNEIETLTATNVPTQPYAIN